MEKNKPTQDKPVRRRKFSVTVLQKEMNRWDRMKITDPSRFKLMRLYIGMPEFLDEYGVYPMNELYHIAVRICNKQSKKLLQLITESASFRFIVDAQTGDCLGFFSAATLQLTDLDSYEVKNREFLQYPPVKLCALQRITDVQKITTPGKKYYILTNPFNPPSEDYRVTGEETENDWAQWMIQAAAKKKQPQPATDYGNGYDFFHQLNHSENGRKDYLEPLRHQLMQRYQLNRIEAGIVLTYLIQHFLIPHFNADPKFRFIPFVGRCGWLRNIIHKGYFQQQMDESYRACLLAINTYRQQQVVNERQAQHENRPLSAFEWTHPQTGQRYYRDPDDGVIDLPADAPARPTATARWNSYTRTWTDEATPETAETKAAEEYPPYATETEPNDGTPDFDDVFGEGETEEGGER